MADRNYRIRTTSDTHDEAETWADLLRRRSHEAAWRDSLVDRLLVDLEPYDGEVFVARSAGSALVRYTDDQGGWVQLNVGEPGDERPVRCTIADAGAEVAPTELMLAWVAIGSREAKGVRVG